MVGVSHRSAPLPVLERLSLGADRIPHVLDSLRSAGCVEVVLLSTCSRTEIYAVAPVRGVGSLIDVLLAPAAPEGRHERVVERYGRDAAAHLFHVTAGLESRVAGEVEIQGQVRAAARIAAEHGSLGSTLRELFDSAVATARRAHRQTSLAALGRSIGRSSVDAALEGLDPTTAAAALVGTGRMAVVTRERLAEVGVRPVVYARCLDRARELSDQASDGRPLAALHQALHEADVIFCATSSRQHLLSAAAVAAAIPGRAGRPLTLVDLGVPRNIDGVCRTIPGVRLVDLEQIGDGHGTGDAEPVAPALSAAANVVAAGLRNLEDARRKRAVGPALAQVHADVEEACRDLLLASHPGVIDDLELARRARSASRQLVHRSMDDVVDALECGDDVRAREIVRLITAPELVTLTSSAIRTPSC